MGVEATPGRRQQTRKGFHADLLLYTLCGRLVKPRAPQSRDRGLIEALVVDAAGERASKHSSIPLLRYKGTMS